MVKLKAYADYVESPEVQGREAQCGEACVRNRQARNAV